MLSDIIANVQTKRMLCVFIGQNGKVVIGKVCEHDDSYPVHSCFWAKTPCPKF